MCRGRQHSVVDPEPSNFGFVTTELMVASKRLRVAADPSWFNVYPDVEKWWLAPAK